MGYLQSSGRSSADIVGSEEIDNLELARSISNILDKELIYEMVDFHTSRPGHDLRYALDGSKMRETGWSPKDLTKRLEQTVNWYIDSKNIHWIE